MVYKELDPFQPDDKYAQFGRAAEEQMAFYLKRHFGDNPEILVLNNIRLEYGGDAAQVDHLIIHPHGLAIVESKSVHGKIQIKDDGQWIRWFNGNLSKGMASPIHQARLQKKFFCDVLGRASKNTAFFEQLPVDLIVAISDTGVIVWPKSGPISGVCKADQVADRILESLQDKTKKAPTPFFSPANRAKIAEFLVAAHRPLEKQKSVELEPVIASTVEDGDSEPLAPGQSSSDKVCKHCGNSVLEIRFGRSYYFFCLKCEKNSSIKVSCPDCGESAKLRKQKKVFFAECAKCSTSNVYYTNP